LKSIRLFLVQLAKLKLKEVNCHQSLAEPTTGDFYIKGKLYENVGSVCDIPDGSLIISNSNDPVAYITSMEYFDLLLFETVPAGSLILQGKIIYLAY